VSVCRHSYGRNFYSIFIKFCTVVRGLKIKIEFGWGKNPITPSPILPQFFTPIMHFQREGPDKTVTTKPRPQTHLYVLEARKSHLVVVTFLVIFKQRLLIPSDGEVQIKPVKRPSAGPGLLISIRTSFIFHFISLLPTNVKTHSPLHMTKTYYDYVTR